MLITQWDSLSPGADNNVGFHEPWNLWAWLVVRFSGEGHELDVVMDAIYGMHPRGRDD